MQVVDTNRSKASFKRLNKQTLEGSGEAERKRSGRKEAEQRRSGPNQQERNKEINCKRSALNHSMCSCQGATKVAGRKQPEERSEGSETEGKQRARKGRKRNGREAERAKESG